MTMNFETAKMVMDAMAFTLEKEGCNIFYIFQTVPNLFMEFCKENNIDEITDEPIDRIEIL